MSMKQVLLGWTNGIALVLNAVADDAAWKEAMIKDALTAAPSSVTNAPEIYAWKAKGDLVKIREGKGRYKCVGLFVNDMEGENPAEA